MRCSDVERLLPQYADDALPASQTGGIDTHLAGCPACRGELTQLQRSLDALNLAAREPAPDLWTRFQSRVAQSSAAACCREIEALLPKFADGELERAETLRVRDHLAECPACTALEAAHSRPLRALETVGRAPAAVELWPAFTVRLGKTLSCREVEALLPAMPAGEPTAQMLPFESHLHACRACADSLSAYETSLSALSRVGSAVPEVDLWPAFAARLEQEATPRRARAVGVGRLPTLGAWLRGPLLQPAIGFAAFALITVAGQLLSQSVSNHLRGTDFGRLSQGKPGEGMVSRIPSASAESETVPPPPQPEMASAAAGASTPDSAIIPSGPRRESPSITPLASAAADSSPLSDSGSELPGKLRAPGVRVAFNLPAVGREIDAAPESVFAPELIASSTVNEREGMQAVVQAVGLLAGSEDALNSPFDAKANDK